MAGLSLCAALAVVAVLVGLLRDDRYEASPPEVSPTTANPAAAASVLHSFEEAVDARDPAASADAAAKGSEDLLEGLIDNARESRIGDFSARYVDELGAPGADGAWTAAVTMTWRFVGFDDEMARSEVLVRFAPRGDGVGIVGFDDGASAEGHRLPLWLRNRLAIVRTEDALVMVDGTMGEARTVVDRVARGVEVVRRVLTDWRQPVVVEVPGSAAALDETLGASAGTYAGIAAVTTSVDGSAERDAPTHVFVNPEVTGRLRVAGAQVVMSHELTHLATGAANSPMDTWLVEGFADYVALRDVDLPDATTLSRAAAMVRERGVPKRLPSTGDFDTRSQDLQTAYELAWLACRVIADQVGERGLIQVYERADEGRPVAAALRETGTSQPALLRSWQERLRDLAG